MEWIKSKTQLFERFNKYKFALLIVVLGIFLMALPTGSGKVLSSEATAPVVPEYTMEEKLARILGQIQGVGKVQVMITEQTGAETVYQMDVDRTDGDGSDHIKNETVIVNSGGAQSGLVRSVTPPIYLGAVIVCQGGSNPTVRLAVANAVSAVTGLSVDRISILAMK